MVSRGEVRRLVHVLIVASLVIAGGPPAMNFVDSGGVKEVSAQLGLNQPPADNPWNKPNVSVYIAGDDLSDEQRQLVVSELRHWERNSQEYADSNVSFVVTDEKDEADLHVYYLDSVVCGSVEEAVGCARTQHVNGTDRLVSAQINVEKGHSAELTRGTIRHEIGHVMGLEHSDASEYPFMSREVKEANA